VAVSEACEVTAAVECAIKWPNDVWIEGRKVAGILVEGRPQEGWAILGIGLNVATAADEFPDELRDIATSLRAAAGNTPPLAAVRDELLERLDTWLARPAEGVIAAWRERDALRGRKVRWADGEGQAAGIADTGALLVETARGQVALDAGEIHLLR
jgi:BirA family biotin operon repressor/biotin-[acetyl-CoA-carboxylase] ligase